MKNKVLIKLDDLIKFYQQRVVHINQDNYKRGDLMGVVETISNEQKKKDCFEVIDFLEELKEELQPYYVND